MPANPTASLKWGDSFKKKKLQRVKTDTDEIENLNNPIFTSDPDVLIGELYQTLKEEIILSL